MVLVGVTLLIRTKRKRTKCRSISLIGRLCSFKSRSPLAFTLTSRPPERTDRAHSNAAPLCVNLQGSCNGDITRARMAQACRRHDKAHRRREELSCMLVGDGAVGKTSMIISYIFNGYNSEYKHTAFDVFTGERLSASQVINVWLTRQ